MGIRRYPTTQERIDRLKEYQGELENELAGVQERLRELAAERGKA